MKARTKRQLRRYWGLLVFALLVIGWFSGFGWPVLIVLSLLSGIYFLFDARVWCSVPTSRDRRPLPKPLHRHPDRLLASVPQKERLKMLVSPRKWGDGLWDSPKDRL